MSTGENKAIICQYFEQVWNQRDLKAAERLLHPDCKARVSGQSASGRDLLIGRLHMAFATYADLHFKVCDLLAEEDRVAARWKRCGTYHDLPTDKQVVVTGMSLFRLRDGRITDIWINADDLGELQQMGVLSEL
jgi:predicted ester cyclase